MSENENTSGENGTVPRTGPRGGVTTVTESGWVKKNLWVDDDAAEWIRSAAFHEKRSEASIIRLGIEMVRKHYQETGEWPTV